MNCWRHLTLRALLGMVIAVLCWPVVAEGPIYRIENNDGSVTYTDNPPANAKSAELKLPPINTRPALPIPEPEKSAQPDPDAQEEQPYSVSRIAQPTQNATIPPGQLDLVVQIDLKPMLQTGHLVKLYHNDQPVGKASASTSFSLTKLVRGKHQVWAEVIGSNGRVKTTTNTVVFHVKRPHSR